MLKESSLLIWLFSRIVRVIERSSKCLTRTTSENLIQRTYLLPRFLHDFDARLVHVSHLQSHRDKPLYLKTQIVPAAWHHQHHEVRVLNQNRNPMLKMLRPTSSRPHMLRSPNWWKISNGSNLSREHARIFFLTSSALTLSMIRPVSKFNKGARKFY